MDLTIEAEPRVSSKGVLSVLAESVRKYVPAKVLRYMLTPLGLFGIPSIFLLAVHNEVVSYQGLDGQEK